MNNSVNSFFQENVYRYSDSGLLMSLMSRYISKIREPVNNLEGIKNNRTRIILDFLALLVLLVLFYYSARFLSGELYRILIIPATFGASSIFVGNISRILRALFIDLNQKENYKRDLEDLLKQLEEIFLISASIQEHVEMSAGENLELELQLKETEIVISKARKYI